MNLLRHTSIGRRLGLGFGVIVAMIVAFTDVTGGLLRDARGAVGQMVDARYPAVRHAADLRGATDETVRHLRGAAVAALLGDRALREDALTRADAANARTDRTLAELTATSDEPRAEALLRALIDARGGYLGALDAASRLLHDDAAQAGAQAVMTTLREQQLRFQAAIQAYGDHQEGALREQAAYTTAAVDRILSALPAVAAAIVILASLAAWAITRSITAPMAQALRVARQVATGDLSARVAGRSRDETGQLLDALGDMTVALTRIVASVRQGSEAVAAASAQIAEGNLDLSGRTEEQAGALQQTSATMEQISATVRNNADQACQADQFAMDASLVARSGGEVVGQVVTTMEGIRDSSRRIGQIIAVIDGIAFQTNLLALNAAVEAARAGEQGVASRWWRARSLAGQAQCRGGPGDQVADRAQRRGGRAGHDARGPRGQDDGRHRRLDRPGSARSSRASPPPMRRRAVASRRPPRPSR